jgi:hypothetical protein
MAEKPPGIPVDIEKKEKAALTAAREKQLMDLQRKEGIGAASAGIIDPTKSYSKGSGNIPPTEIRKKYRMGDIVNERGLRTSGKLYTDEQGNPLGTSALKNLSALTPEQIAQYMQAHGADPSFAQVEGVDPNQYIGRQQRGTIPSLVFGPPPPGIQDSLLELIQSQRMKAGGPSLRERVSNLLGIPIGQDASDEAVMNLLEFFIEQKGLSQQGPTIADPLLNFKELQKRQNTPVPVTNMDKIEQLLRIAEGSGIQTLQFMANGGIVTEPTAAIVGERGPEMVMGGAGNTNPRRTTQSQQAQAAGQGPAGAGRQYSPLMQGDRRVGTQSRPAPFGPLQQQRFGPELAPGQPIYGAEPGANYAATPQQFLGRSGEFGSSMGDAGQGQMWGQMDYGPLVAAQQARQADHRAQAQQQMARMAGMGPVGAGRQYNPIMQGGQQVGTQSAAAPFGPFSGAMPGGNYPTTPSAFRGRPSGMHGASMGDTGQSQMFGQMDFGPMEQQMAINQQAQQAAMAAAQQQMAQAAGMGPMGYGRQYSPLMQGGQRVGTQSAGGFGPYQSGGFWADPGMMYGSTPQQFLGMGSGGFGSSMGDTGQSQMKGQMDFGPMEQQMRLREQARQGNQQQMMMGGNPLNMLPFAALAGGGQINQPMMALVGEQGPELAMLQPGDAIIPLGEGQAQQFAEIPGMIKAQDGLNVDLLAQQISDPLYESLFRNRMAGQYVDPKSVFPSSIFNPGFTLSLDDPKYKQLGAGYEKVFPDLVAEDFELSRIPGQTPEQYLSDPLTEAVEGDFRLPTKVEYAAGLSRSAKIGEIAEKEKEKQEQADKLSLSEIVLPDTSGVNTETILNEAAQGYFTPAVEAELLSYINQLTPMIATFNSDLRIQLAITDPDTGLLKNPEEVNRLNALIAEATTKLSKIQNTYSQATKYRDDWLSRQKDQRRIDIAAADRAEDADLQRELNQSRLDQATNIENIRYQREREATAPTPYSTQFLNFLAQQLTQSGNVPSQEVLQGLSLSEWLSTLSPEEVQAVLASLSGAYGQGGQTGQFQPGSLRFA